MSYLISTTGTDVSLDDLVGNDNQPLEFTHPTTDFNLSSLYTEDSIRDSADLLAALTAGTLTMTYKGDPIDENALPFLGMGPGFSASELSFNPNNTAFVAENGDDSNPGTFGAPYRTIGAAVAATPSGTFIWVFPGVYNEDPIELSGIKSVFGMSDQGEIRVIANDDSFPLFTSIGGDNSILNMEIEDVSSATAIVRSGPGPSLRVINVGIQNCQRGIEVNNGGVCFAQRVVMRSGGAPQRLATVTDGATMTIDTSTVPPGVTVTDSIFVVEGSGSNLNIQGASFRTPLANRVVDINNGGLANLNGVRLIAGDNGIRLDNGSTLEINSTTISNGVVAEHINVVDANSEIRGSSFQMNRDRVALPGGFTGDNVLFTDTKEGDKGQVLWGELSVGRPCCGKESIFGRGDSYTAGLVVLTSDGNATSTTEGGNITNVSTDAYEVGDGNFVSFQGTTEGHTVMIGSDLSDAAEKLKHFGVKLAILDRAFESLNPKSFSFEIWDGSAWVEIGTMATQSSLFYRYGNVHFLRPNNSEHIRYGVDEQTTWQKKTIGGFELFWSRIRVNTDVSQTPTFDQIKLSPSRTEINQDGTVTYHGESRHRATLIALGNIFGESGGVNNVTVNVGSGGVPTGWAHNIKNSGFNSNGDAIYFQLAIPRGVDTSYPLDVRVKYNVTQAGAAGDGSMIVSLKPMEVSGVRAADPAGGIVPLDRTPANTEAFTDTPAQAVTEAVDLGTNEIIYSLDFQGFDISDFYEGDMLAFRVEYDDDGPNNKDITIWSVEVSAQFWTNGEHA